MVKMMPVFSQWFGDYLENNNCFGGCCTPFILIVFRVILFIYLFWGHFMPLSDS